MYKYLPTLCTYRRLARNLKVPYLQYLIYIWCIYIPLVHTIGRRRMAARSLTGGRRIQGSGEGRCGMVALSIQAQDPTGRRRPRKREVRCSVPVQSPRPEIVFVFPHWLLCATNQNPVL